LYNGIERQFAKEASMNLLVDFNTIEEARLSAAAKQIGLAPAEYVRKVVSNTCHQQRKIATIDSEDQSW
jgi:hypothetical protein